MIHNWDRTFELPPPSTFAKDNPSLEKEFRFTTCTEYEDLLCFVSTKTDRIFFNQLIGFFPYGTKFYQTTPETIDERLFRLDRELNVKNNNAAGKALHNILDRAVSTAVTDIHLQRNNRKIEVRYRCKGIMGKPEIIENIGDYLSNKIRVLSGMDSSGQLGPQDGSFEFRQTMNNIYDIRVSAIPCVSGEKTVLRILPKNKVLKSLEDLNLSPSVSEKIGKVITEKAGLVLMCGATGSGKTTTLYAILQKLLKSNLSIVTLEDPVEIRIPEISQVKLNPMMGMGLSNGLKYVLRQDPDVIMIGEIRDAETARLAVSAAQTGHFVLSTVHGGDPIEAIGRLLSFGADVHDVLSCIKIVLYQELIPYGCDCELDNGCEKCGYTGVVDMAPVTATLSGLDKYLDNFSETKFHLNNLRKKEYYTSLEEDYKYKQSRGFRFFNRVRLG